MTTFYVDIAKILDRVDVKVLYKSRNIKKDGTSDFYQLSIVDAHGFLKEKIYSISSKIFSEELSAYSSTSGSFVYDEDNVFFKVEFPSTFNVALIPSIERSIEDVIVNWTVFQWMYNSNYEYRKDEEEYLKSIDGLRSLITRRKNLVRTYKLY